MTDDHKLTLQVEIHLDRLEPAAAVAQILIVALALAQGQLKKPYQRRSLFTENGDPCGWARIVGSLPEEDRTK